MTEKKSEMDYIKFNLPKELKRKFKSLCSLEGVTITDKLLGFIKYEIENSNLPNKKENELNQE